MHIQPEINVQLGNINIAQQDWKFRVRKINGRLYLTAYRQENGRRVERSLGSLEPSTNKKVHSLRIGKLILVIVNVDEL